MKIPRLVNISAGIAIAALSLYIFLKDVEMGSLIGELKSVKPLSLVLACFFIIATMYLRALRWKSLLPDIPGTSKKYLFSNVTIGFMINNILPARIGEFARAFILWKKNQFPLTISLGTLFLERIIDIIIYALFFIIPVFLLPQCTSLTYYAYLLSAVVIGSIVCLVLYFSFQNTTEKIVRWFIAKLPERFRDKTLKIYMELASTLNWLKSPKRFLNTLYLSLLTSLCYPLMIIVLSRNAGIQFGLLEGMFAQAFAAFGAAIPLSPGYVGTLHAIMLQGLEILGMDIEKARALTIVYHAVNYLLITALGLVLFFRMKLSIKEIASAKDEMP